MNAWRSSVVFVDAPLTRFHSVIVAIAMEDEAKPFIDHLKLEKVDGFFPVARDRDLASELLQG